ncbi:hypothetical protein V6N13_139155 [Hibiscus sabdariffa]
MRLHLSVALICATVSLFAIARAEDPYRFFTWNVTYGDIFPLGVRQTDLRAQLDGGKTLPLPDGILINGRGPGGASFNVEQGIFVGPNSGVVSRRAKKRRPSAKTQTLLLLSVLCSRRDPHFHFSQTSRIRSGFLRALKLRATLVIFIFHGD